MPYKSKAQAAYFNIHRAQLERQGVDVDEWNAASKGKRLPERSKTKPKAKPKREIINRTPGKNRATGQLSGVVPRTIRLVTSRRPTLRADHRRSQGKALVLQRR